MPLTLKQAAEQAGKSKQAIQQAIKAGKISATKNANGEWEIEASELFRVYQPINKIDTKNVNGLDAAWHGEIEKLTPASQTKIIELTVNSEAKDKEIALLKKRADELETERDSWREQAQRLALTYQRTPPEQETTLSAAEKKRNWWKFWGERR